MAPPPPKRLLSKEDAPGAPEWLERLLGPLNAFINPAATALGQGLTFRENFAGEVRTVDVLCPDDWVLLAPFLTNGWAVNTNAGRPAAAIRKALDGTVSLRGTLARAAGAPAAGSSILTWPSGYEPDGRRTYGFATNTGLGAAEATTGNLLYFSGGVATYPLDEMRYAAANGTPVRWATPVDVKLGTAQRPFPGRPGSVQVLRATVQGNLTAPAVVTALDAEFINLERAKASPGVRIHRVWGLVPGVRYTLTILVLPE